MVLVIVWTHKPVLVLVENKSAGEGFFPNRHLVFVHSWHLKEVWHLTKGRHGKCHNIREVI